MQVKSILYTKSWVFDQTQLIQESPYRALQIHEDYEKKNITEDDLIQQQQLEMYKFNQKYEEFDRLKRMEPFKYPYEDELDREQQEKLKEQQQSKKLDNKDLKTMNQQFITKEKKRFITIKLQQYLPEVIKILAQMIDLDIQQEQLKCELCLQKDFLIKSLYDNFYIIPQNNKEVEGITLKEFMQSCLNYGIKADEIDCQLLLTKYQDTKKLKEIYVNFEEFHKLFYPLSRDDLFAKKMDQGRYTLHREVKQKQFSQYTSFLIEQLLKQSLNQEFEIEEMRKQLSSLDFDLVEVFHYINKKNDGQVTASEFKQFFDDSSILFSEPELKCFLLRINKFKTYFITKEQFVRELTAKTGLKC